MAKIRNFDSLGAVFPHFCLDKPRAKFHVYRGNVSPLRGEKPIFGPLSKNNTGMAALRAGLPVMKEKDKNTKAHTKEHKLVSTKLTQYSPHTLHSTFLTPLRSSPKCER